MESDRFLSIVAAKFVNENPVALDMAVATTIPFAVERVITMTRLELLLPDKDAHDCIELFDVATA